MIRTHVLLHPYGTADGYKQILASKDQTRVNRVIQGYQKAGWAGKIHTVRASSFDDAVAKLHARLYPEEAAHAGT